MNVSKIIYNGLLLIFFFNFFCHVFNRYESLPLKNSSSFTGSWHLEKNDIIYEDFNHTLVGGVLQVIIEFVL